MSATTPDTPQVLLEHHLKALRLPTMLREYDKLARTCAAEKATFPTYLLQLTELELLDRDRRATERRIRQAKFPVVKSLDSFDFLAIPATEPEDPQLAAEPISIHTLRVQRAQLMGITYHGRWEDLSYSDHAFLYDAGISLDNPNGGLL